jgi:hypothetical protein
MDMKHEDIKIGMKVVPHSKTAGIYLGFNNWIGYDLCKDFKKDGYLIVTDFYNKFNCWILDCEEDTEAIGYEPAGDYFNASDFEPYNENTPHPPTQENKQMEPKQLTQKEITQQAKRERGKKVKEIREKFGIEKVLKNGHTLIFFFKDGSKVVEQCQPEDKFDWSVAFALAYVHHMSGSKALYIEAVDKMIEQNMTVVNKKGMVK